jgi:hypothetical protein
MCCQCVQQQRDGASAQNIRQSSAHMRQSVAAAAPHLQGICWVNAVLLHEGDNLRWAQPIKWVGITCSNSSSSVGKSMRANQEEETAG